MAEPEQPARKRSSTSSRTPNTAGVAARQTAPVVEEQGPDLDPTRQSSSVSGLSSNQPPRPVPDDPSSPIARPDYSNDAASGTDRLSIGREVDALAYLIASREVVPPLSIGLFGDWGSGKTFFMGQLRRRVARLARASNGARDKAPFHHNIIQIDFNAWHYIEANLWASLAIRVFEGLTGALAEMNAPTDRLEQQLLETMKASNANVLAAEALKATAEQQIQAAQAGKKKALRELEAYVGEIKPGVQNVHSTLEAFGTGKATVNESERVKQLKKIGDLRDIPALVEMTWQRIRRLPRAQIVVVAAAVLAALTVGIAWSVVTQSIGPGGWAAVLSAAGIVVAVGNLIRSIASAASSLADAAGENENVRRALTSHRLASTKLRKAQHDLTQARSTLTELQSQTPDMYRFVRDRYSSLDYQKALGIVALIQKDFESLSELLHDPKDAGNTQVERIVLYIDDLDRCPPKLVVEVLQAVHLLLAFPLFVVVVAVDSRWLLESLSTIQRAAWQSTSGDLSAGSSDEDSWSTTPQNYLEKIFQIPFWIRPMTSAGYSQLVSSLTSPAAETKDPLESEVESQTALPDPVRLDPLEIASMQLMAPLIPTPRATKRLVNTYRLLRSSVPSDEVERFVGSDTTRGDHRAVLLLLGIIAGFPQFSTDVLAKLEESDAESWSSFMSTLQGEAAMGEMLDALSRTSGGDTRLMDLPGGLEPFKRWAPIVARYSFGAGRLIPALNRLSANGRRFGVGATPDLVIDETVGATIPG